jgi:type IV secretory pathway TrbL component
MSAGGSNAGKEGASEAVGVKEINQQVKNMMETTRRNLLELQQTKRKMQGIKQAY